MTPIDASLTAGASGAGSADDVTAQQPVMVYTCNRLGRVANPQRIANDIKAAVVRFVKKPAVAVSLAGAGVLVVVVTFRRIRRR